MKIKEILDIVIFNYMGKLPYLVLLVQATTVQINQADQATKAGNPVKKFDLLWFLKR